MSKDTPMTSLTQLFTTTAPLHALIQRGQALQQLEEQLKLQLPEALRTHCSVANLTADRSLILLTDSAAWATQLRYCHDLLLSHTQRITGQVIARLEIRVRPSHFATSITKTTDSSPAPLRKMSQETQDLLRSVADSMADSSLRTALHQLAKSHDTETGCK
jgi:hypothetical protein